MALRILNLWTGIAMAHAAIVVLVLGFSFFGTFVRYVDGLMRVGYTGSALIGLFPLYYIIGLTILFVLSLFYSLRYLKEGIIPEGQGDNDMLIDEKGGRGELVAP